MLNADEVRRSSRSYLREVAFETLARKMTTKTLGPYVIAKTVAVMLGHVSYGEQEALTHWMAERRNAVDIPYPLVDEDPSHD